MAFGTGSAAEALAPVHTVPTPWQVGPYRYVVQEFPSFQQAWCAGEHGDAAACGDVPAVSFAAVTLMVVAILVTLLRPQMLPDGVHKTKSWHLKQHNNVNLVVLPLMTFLAVLCALAILPNKVVCFALAGYMAFDFLWISIFPKAVASKPKLILVHHAVTFFLAVASHFTDSRFGYMCAFATCVELNTFLLVAMRHPAVKGTAVGGAMTAGFWATALIFRMGVHPWLVYHAAVAVPAIHPGMRACVVLGMTFMCIFNGYYVYLRVKADAQKAKAASKKQG